MELYSQQDPLVLNSSTESLGMFSSILQGKKKTRVYLREKLLCSILMVSMPEKREGQGKSVVNCL